MYIWEKEIKSVEWEKIIFTDGSETELSEKYREYLSTEEPLTESELQIRKSLKVQIDILCLFKDANLNKTECSNALMNVSTNLARYEKDILCSLTGATDYIYLPFRKINELHMNIDNSNFTN